MTASYGLSQTDIEQYTGVCYTDLMQSGTPMTLAQWQTFISTYVEVIAQIVHRYCNVPTFDPAQPEASIVELHSGRGATDDSVWPTQYNTNDYEFWLNQLYCTNNTYPAVVVQEDTAGKTAIPAWTTRTERKTGQAGDYEVVTKKEVTMIAFYNNVPAQGDNNVRFTYTTGYDPASKEYADIRFQILRVFKNLILSKKGVQSVLTIFAQGVKNYSEIGNQYTEAQILSHMEESTLRRYKRYMVPGGPFTD